MSAFKTMLFLDFDVRRVSYLTNSMPLTLTRICLGSAVYCRRYVDEITDDGDAFWGRESAFEV
jgi:hypothetical protein